MDHVVQHVCAEIGLDAPDVAQRIGGEVPRGAVVRVLILLPRDREHGRMKAADNGGELLREILAAISRRRHDDFRRTRPVAARVRRHERVPPLRPVGRHQATEAVVREAEECQRAAFDAERFERRARFVLTVDTVHAIVRAFRIGDVLFDPDAGLVALAVGQVHDANVAMSRADALNQSTCSDHFIVGMRGDDEQAGAVLDRERLRARPASRRAVIGRGDRQRGQ